MPTIIRMVNHTRLDCLIGSAAVDALGHRPGRAPRPPPLARSASCWPSSRRCRTCWPTWRSSPRPPPPPRCGSRAPTTRTTRRSGASPPRSSKYWVCKRAPPHADEALECLGGNGYVEESGMPRLLPRLPAQLDLGGLGQRGRAGRAARDGQGARGPARLPGRGRAGARRQRAARRPRRPAEGASPRSPTATRSGGAPRSSRTWRWRCRRCLLVRHAPPAVADAFCAGRLGRRRPRVRHAAGRRGRRRDRRARAGGLARRWWNGTRKSTISRAVTLRRGRSDQRRGVLAARRTAAPGERAARRRPTRSSSSSALSARAPSARAVTGATALLSAREPVPGAVAVGRLAQLAAVSPRRGRPAAAVSGLTIGRATTRRPPLALEEGEAVERRSC